ncbi:MAG: xanthine phosphoribosyltransferase [Clostridia bacterium]|nr:xanthine phosphoribosyltransferase [Clostridia bacterium]
MELLKQKICAEGRIYAGDVLKVDSFLNHRMDVDFLCLLGKEFYERFADCGVNKILTIEASGIGIACLTAQFFHCPVLFAKKAKTSNLSDELWVSEAHSYTHNTDHKVCVSKSYLGPDDRVLIIDDFLANGSALNALIELCRQAGAEVIGAGIVIEKAYQEGGDMIRAQGVRVESLARVRSMDPEMGVVFAD